MVFETCEHEITFCESEQMPDKPWTLNTVRFRLQRGFPCSIAPFVHESGMQLRAEPIEH